MIKIRKRQLSDSPYVHLACLTILLLGIFIYATAFAHRLFVLLGGGLALTVVSLISLQIRYASRHARMGLQKQEFLEKTNVLEEEIRKEDLAMDSCRFRIRGFSRLHDLAETISMTFTPAQTSQTLAREVNGLFSNKDFTIILYTFNPRNGELEMASCRKGQMEFNVKAKKGDLYDHWLVKAMRPLLVEDTKRDFRFDSEKAALEKDRPVRSLISAPMHLGDKAVGILRLDSPQENQFGAYDLRILTAVADLGAMAMENAQLYERLEDLAIHDSLTGLFLRRYFLERFSHELVRELRQKEDLSFIMLDLDHFKKYNDSFGHMSGDVVLKAVSSILTKRFSAPGELIARYGGEEFGVLLPQCSKARAVQVAQELCGDIATREIILRREKTHITASVGVATFPEDAQTRDELIQQADQALYRAKKQGRNRVCAA